MNDPTPIDPFALLGVSEDADAPALKRAYYKKVRQHPPEKDPELFQRIRAAYELLSDPERRRHYLAERSHSEELTELLEEAERFANENRWASASRVLERAVVLAPHREHLYAQLSFTLYRSRKIRDAHYVIDRWMKLAPDSLDPWIHRASLELMRAANAPKLGEEERAGLGRAIQDYQEVLRRDPRNAQALLDLGECHRISGDRDEAMRCFASIDSIEGILRQVQCEARVRLAALFIEFGDEMKLEELAAELAQRSRGEPELAEFLAWRFFELATKDPHPKPTREVLLPLEIAERLVPPPSELRDNLQRFRQYLRITDEAEQLCANSKIPLRLREYLGQRLFFEEDAEIEGQRGEILSPDDLDREFLFECDQLGMFEIRRGVGQIRRHYPIAEERVGPLLDALLQRASLVSRWSRILVSPRAVTVFAVIVGLSLALYTSWTDSQQRKPPPPKEEKRPWRVFYTTEAAAEPIPDGVDPTKIIVIAQPALAGDDPEYVQIEGDTATYRFRPPADSRLLEHLRGAHPLRFEVYELLSQNPPSHRDSADHSSREVWLRRAWLGSMQIYPVKVRE